MFNEVTFISWSNSLEGSALGFRAGIENLLLAQVSLRELTADLSGVICFLFSKTFAHVSSMSGI